MQNLTCTDPLSENKFLLYVHKVMVCAVTVEKHIRTCKCVNTEKSYSCTGWVTISHIHIPLGSSSVVTGGGVVTGPEVVSAASYKHS